MSSRKLMPSHSINGAMTVPHKDSVPSPKPDAPSSGNSTEESTIQIDEDGTVTETFSRDQMTDVTIDEYANDAMVRAMLAQLGMTSPAEEETEDETSQPSEDKRERIQMAFKCIACNSDLPCMFITVGYKHDHIDESHVVKPMVCKGQREPVWTHEYTIPYVA